MAVEFDLVPRTAKRDLSNGALRVLIGILEFRWHNQPTVRFYDAQIGEILGCHPNSVRRHYPELESKGYIRRVDVRRGLRVIELRFPPFLKEEGGEP